MNWIRENVSGNRILDVGFVGEYEESAAHIAIAEENPDAELVGVDLKRDAERVRDAGVQGDLYSLPFADASFDGIVFAEVLEHLTRPFDALRELHRVLESGGRLYVTTPNPLGFYRYLRHYLFKPVLDTDFYLGASDHVAFIDPMSLEGLLDAAGFTILDTAFRNVSTPKTPTLPDWQWLQKWPFNRGGSYTCITAEK